MRKFIFTLAVVYISGTILYAQEAVIKGRLVDTYSSEVITDVQIHILSSNFETKTDMKGLFALIGSDFPKGERIKLFGFICLSAFSGLALQWRRFGCVCLRCDGFGLS